MKFRNHPKIGQTYNVDYVNRFNSLEYHYQGEVKVIKKYDEGKRHYSEVWWVCEVLSNKYSFYKKNRNYPSSAFNLSEIPK